MTNIEYCVAILVLVGGIVAEIFRPTIFQLAGIRFTASRHDKFGGYVITYCSLLALLLSVTFIPKGFWLAIACGVCFFIIGVTTFSTQDYVGNVAVALTALSMIIYHTGCAITHLPPHTTLVLFTAGLVNIVAEILVRTIG